MRRLVIEDPVSQAARWSWRLGVFALAVAGMAVALSRSGAVDSLATLAVLAAACLIAVVTLLLSATAMVVIWRFGIRGFGLASGGALLAVAMLAYPAYLATQAVRLPLLADVSTDLDDPPAFSRSAKALAARGGYTPSDPGAGARAAQRANYPALQPIILEMEGPEAYALVLKAAAARGYQVVEASAPGGRAGLGHVDAIARTLVMGFKDDVVIRIRPLAGQTRVDIRSASRYGRHDFGTNATRIQAFAAELETQLETDK